MPYRRTDNVVRRQARRHAEILRAARQTMIERGMDALQIAPVAERAGIATGTMYRYFPSKTELVGALIQAMSEQELGAIRRAAAAAPGPLSALSAAIVTFASRALRGRKLVWALLAEPADSDIAAMRIDFRQSLAAEFQTRIAAAMAHGHFPEQDAARAAIALIGALIEGLVSPLAADSPNERDAVQALTLLSLRALGVNDPRARGLVVQTALPPRDQA